MDSLQEAHLIKAFQGHHFVPSSSGSPDDMSPASLQRRQQVPAAFLCLLVQQHDSGICTMLQSVGIDICQPTVPDRACSIMRLKCVCHWASVHFLHMLVAAYAAYRAMAIECTFSLEEPLACS